MSVVGSVTVLDPQVYGCHHFQVPGTPIEVSTGGSQGEGTLPYDEECR